MTSQPQRRRFEELSMKQRDAIRRLRNLATYIAHGTDDDFDLIEPAPRGRKGRDHSAHRSITFVVHHVMRFDDIGWAQWGEEIKPKG